MKKKALSFIMVLTMAASLLVGCGSSDGKDSGNAAGTENGGGSDFKSVTVVNEQSGLDISPFAGRNRLIMSAGQELYASLALPSEPGQELKDFQLDMAKSMNIVDDSTVEFELYDYITDSEGNKITAEDVKFSFDQMSAEGGIPAVSAAIEDVEVTGDYTFTMHFTDGAVGKKEFAISQVGIVSKEWYQNASAEEISSTPATTGPYYVSDFRTGSRVVLTKNENYWQTDESLIPKMHETVFDEINYIVITEAAQRTIAIENGEADVSPISPQDIDRFMNDDGTAKEGWSVWQSTMPGLYALFMNMDENSTSPLASNIKLREAVAYALDRESIRLGAGQTATSGAIVNGYTSPGLAGYNPDFEYYTYDIDRAQKAMDESGAKDVTLKLLYSTDIGITGAETVIQQNLSQIGIKVDLVPTDQALFNTYKYDSSQWDLMIDYKGAANGFSTFMFTSAFDSSAYENGAVNFSHDTTLESLALTAASDFTQENVDAFQEYLRDQYQIVGLFYMNNYVVGQDGFEEIGYDGALDLNINSSVLKENWKSVVR